MNDGVEENKVASERYKQARECVLVSERQIRNTTIRKLTDDVHGATEKFGLVAANDQ
jgi:hypothetical protein